MAKVYAKGSIFDHPPRSRRLAWYAKMLCSILRKQEQISKEDIKRFCGEVRSKQDELPFSWQRNNLGQQAKKYLNDLLSGYDYDTGTGVYKRK